MFKRYTIALDVVDHLTEERRAVIVSATRHAALTSSTGLLPSRQEGHEIISRESVRHACLHPVDKHTALRVASVVRQRIAHHGPTFGISSVLPRLSRSTIHLLNAAEPLICVEGLAERNAIRAKELPPLLLNVEPHFSSLHQRLDGHEETLLQPGKGTGIVRVDYASRGPLEALLTQAGILHLFGKTRLLALEHVAEEFIQLGLLFDW
mmetsp:Transcript_11601/g.24453  ORF Transcript_11601/g.24453 Transcript_11601/m.24453 type:complete len:208 (-) Transcript_11601:505-1128(-)